ncbi:fimbrial usher protein, partial [Haemophilus influenzae HK1212]
DGAYWGGGSKLGVDFSRFNQKNAVLPGEYDAEVRVNNVLKGNVRLRFADNDETQRAELCLTPALQEMLDLEKSAIKQQGEEDSCVWAKYAIPDAVFTYQTGE